MVRTLFPPAVSLRTMPANECGNPVARATETDASLITPAAGHDRGKRREVADHSAPTAHRHCGRKR